jgi:hypothetical protein
MRYTEFLAEDPLNNQPNAAEFDAMKSVIAGKIRQLPADSATAKALKEIEDLLKNVHAGGRMGIINSELATIEDPTVTAYQKTLARYLLSLDATPEQRNQLMELWRTDRLVDVDKLTRPGKLVTFSDVFTAYDANPMIKEFVDDVMRESALGQGKGEFGLSVLSKRINKMPNKGDLYINGHSVELKTNDEGAARFTDQEIRPASGYEQAAEQLEQMVRGNLSVPIKVAASGLNLTTLVDFAKVLQDDERKMVLDQAEKVITLIFGGKHANRDDIKPIMRAIRDGDAGAALQAYSVANLHYYINTKNDDGVLYIDLTKEPSEFVFYRDAKDLAKSKLRLHAGTPYLTNRKDMRLAYPQMQVTSTTFGANRAALAAKAAEKAKKAAAKGITFPKYDGTGSRADKAMFREKVYNHLSKLVKQRGITDVADIGEMADMVSKDIIKGTDTQTVLSRLLQAFPELRSR